MPVKRALSTTQALTNVDSQSSALGVQDRTDRSQGDVGHRLRLWRLVGYLDTLAGGPTQVIAKIVRDANGDEAIIAEQTLTIEVGRTTATDGAVSMPLDFAISLAVGTLLYVVARLDAGTANAVWELHFQQGG